MSVQTTTSVREILGDEAAHLLDHECMTIARRRLHLPGPDFVDRVLVESDRNNRVIGNLSWLFHHGRLSGTGYLSILPVDQGIEHTAGASFAPNPDYFDPEGIIRLAIDGRLQCRRVDARRPGNRLAEDTRTRFRLS